MSSIQFAWMMYVTGSIGCSLVAWWMFSWAWRFVRYSAVVTVLVLLLVPYSIDGPNMTLAPGIYTLVFDGIAQGMTAIKPLLKLMIGIWSIAIIIVALYVVLTRKHVAEILQENDSNADIVQPEDITLVNENKELNSTTTESESTQEKSHEQKKSRKKIKSHEQIEPHEEIKSHEQIEPEKLWPDEIPIRAIRDE